MRSGDDWELGSWQPYNPEWPGLQQATHFGTAQPCSTTPNHLFKYVEKYAEVPSVARLQDMVLVSAQMSPPSPPYRNFEGDDGDGSSKRRGVFMRHQRHSAPKSEVYLNVGMPSTYGPAAASSQDVPSQAGLKDVRRRRAT